MTNSSYDFLKALVHGKDSAREDTYLNSPLYYMLTGRKGTWLYQDDKSSLIVCAHPHIEERLMVFPEIGRADYALTSSVLGALPKQENGVQLARYSDADLSTLKRQLARTDNRKVAGLTVREETMMDWRYPVHILDTDVVSVMEGSDFAKIRNKFRKAADGLTHTPINAEEDLRTMRAAVKFWEGTMIFNNKETDGMSDFYHALFDTVSDHPDHIEGMIYLQGRRPVGMTLWDQPQEQTANIFVNLGDTSITGLSDFQLVTTCQRLQDHGVNFANMGGSEIESLDAFKRKFMPARSIPLLSADIIYNDDLDQSIQVHTLVEPETTM